MPGLQNGELSGMLVSVSPGPPTETKMMDARLIKMLVCPENRTRLELAEPDLLDRLNRAITAGRIRNRAGQTVSEPLAGALIREDHTVLYPIVDGIPSLLVDEAIPLEQLEK